MTIQPIRLTSIGGAVALEPADACGCGGGSCAVGSASAPDAVGGREVFVEGMTCEHCVRAVTDEVGGLDGVDGVEIDLVSGGASRVRIRASAPVSDAAVRRAVEEAGYRLV